MRGLGARDTAKALSTFAGQSAKHALKRAAHLADSLEPTLRGDPFQAVLTFFETPPGNLDSKSLNKECGSGLHLFRKEAPEIASTHRYVFSKQPDTKL